MTEASDGDAYTIERSDPFARKEIVGCYVYITCKGDKRVYTYSFEELENHGKHRSKRCIITKARLGRTLKTICT